MYISVIIILFLLLFYYVLLYKERIAIFPLYIIPNICNFLVIRRLNIWLLYLFIIFCLHICVCTRSRYYKLMIPRGIQFVFHMVKKVYDEFRLSVVMRNVKYPSRHHYFYLSYKTAFWVYLVMSLSDKFTHT